MQIYFSSTTLTTSPRSASEISTRQPIIQIHLESCDQNTYPLEYCETNIITSYGYGIKNAAISMNDMSFMAFVI